MAVFSIVDTVTSLSHHVYWPLATAVHCIDPTCVTMSTASMDKDQIICYSC